MAKFEGYSWEKMPLIVELTLVLLYVLKNHEQGAQDDHLDFHTGPELCQQRQFNVHRDHP